MDAISPNLVGSTELKGGVQRLKYMAHELYLQGAYPEAEALDRKVYETRRAKLGKDHPSTLRSMGHLACSLSNQGRYAESQTLYREMYETQIRVLGVDHLKTLESMSDVASILYHQGRHFDAELLCRDLYEARRRLLGEDHISTLQALQDVATCVYRQGKYYEEAETLYRKVYEARIRVLGVKHRDTLQSLGHLASTIFKQGRHSDAEKLFRDLWRARKRVLGEAHVETHQTLLALEATIYSRKHNQEAETLKRRAYQRHIRDVVPNGPKQRNIHRGELQVEAPSSLRDQRPLSTQSLNRSRIRVHRKLRASQRADNHNEVTPRLRFQQELSLPRSLQPLWCSTGSEGENFDYFLGDFEGQQVILRSTRGIDQAAISQWKHVMHPKLPRAIKFLTDTTVFACAPPPGENDFETELTELYIVIEILERNYRQLYDSSEERQLVILMTIARTKPLSQIISTRNKFIRKLLAKEDLVSSCGATNGPRVTVIMDLLQMFLDHENNIYDIDSISQAFKLLRKLSRNVQALPRSLSISSPISNVSRHPVASGGSSDVFTGECFGKKVALKVLKQPGGEVTKEIFAQLSREALIWKYTKHPNLLPFIGYYPQKGACLVIDWMKNGTLKSFIAHPECDYRKMSVQLAHGLTYLHKVPGIVHGDLRSDNVLIDENFNLRISDFGLALLVSNMDNLNVQMSTGGAGSSGPFSSSYFGGAVRWMAPEYLARTVDQKSMAGDVYAFACVLIEVFSGKQPLPWIANHLQIPVEVCLNGDNPGKGITDEDMAFFRERGLEQKSLSLMQSCWARKPEERPDMFSVCQELGKAWDMKWDSIYHH